MRRTLSLFSLLVFAQAAHASDQPLYQAAPTWVLPAPRAQVTAPTADTPQTVILDSQTRVENGQVWRYQETAQRMISADALNRMGPVKLEWAPDHGDLIIHGVEIIRDGQKIDVLAAGGKFTVLRREAGLERQMLDGELTATLAVEGLRVGDILDMRFSITSKDATLRGNVASAAFIAAEPLRVAYGRARLLWPEATPIAWKLYPTGATPSESAANGWREVNVTFPVPKQPDAAPNAPGRYAKPPMIELSSFADWQAVSRVMAPLYATEGLIAPGSPLAQEVARIAGASKDPRQRTLLALQLVQDKVRYFLKAMDGGNYVPQTPTETWASRYGDCKAKTLLLLAILHELGIEAEPAAANLGSGDLVSVRLPSTAAFNHVFVVAKVNGQTLWLDGTALGARLEDLDDVAAYGWVLPLRASGATLLEVPDRVPARPMIEYKVKMDMRAGVALPAPVDAQILIRGALAGQMRTNLAALDKEGRDRVLIAMAGQIQGMLAFAPPRFDFDEATGAATIAVTGVGLPSWTRADNRYSFEAAGLSVRTPPDRSRSIWKEIPILAGGPSSTLSERTILLPGGGKDFSLEGSPDVDVTLPGNHRLRFNAKLANGELTTRLLDEQAGGEITVAQIPELRQKGSDMTSHATKLRTIAGYPAPWQGIEAAKRAHLFDKTLDIFAQSIATKPDEAGRYLSRATFYATIFEREKAIADLDKALALQADKRIYQQRASLYQALGQKDKAIADLKSATELDPGDVGAISTLASLESRSGQSDAALARLDQAIDAGGNNAPFLMAAKAHIQADAGQIDDALVTMDAAIEKRPGNAQLLNDRCWLKGTRNVDLELAIKDCSRAIELSDTIAPAALDSRAMVYFRQNRLEEALADLKSAMDLRPGQAGTLFLRALVERKMGQADKGTQDLADARMLYPKVDEDYARYGISW